MRNVVELGIICLLWYLVYRGVLEVLKGSSIGEYVALSVVPLILFILALGFSVELAQKGYRHIKGKRSFEKIQKERQGLKKL